METMQAIAYQAYGTADVLQLMTLPRPTLAPDEVLVRVAAAGINPADWVIRSGQLRLFVRLKFPFIPGADVAGNVAAVGTAVTRFKPGDTVYAMLPNVAGGGYAEYAAVKESLLARLPIPLSMAEAAAVPLTALTALQGIRDAARLLPHQHLLINGASGGVGSFAVQIAKAMGARVTAVCSGHNADLVGDLGADTVIDYTQTDIFAITAQYDVIFDAVGLYPFAQWRPLLKPNGIAVSVNPTMGNPLQSFFARFSRDGKRMKSFLVKPSGTDLETLNAWISDGKLRPVIDRAYPLAAAAEAHRYSETKRVRGKLILLVNETLIPAADVAKLPLMTTPV